MAKLPQPETLVEKVPELRVTMIERPLTGSVACSRTSWLSVAREFTQRLKVRSVESVDRLAPMGREIESLFPSKEEALPGRPKRSVPGVVP